MKTFLIHCLIFCLLLSGCTTASAPDSSTNSETPSANQPPTYAPQAGDDQLLRGEAFVESFDMLVLESFPLQFVFNLEGSLPTPCHQIRAIVSPPNADNRIDIELYTVVDPNTICVQVLEPFQINIPLGSFPTGRYHLFINNEAVVSFDA